MPFTRRIRGRFDVAGLGQALTGLVARHEPLRTRYVDDDAEPRRVIEEPFPVKLERISLDEVDAAEQEERAHAWLIAQLRIPLDIAVGPPFRAALMRLADEDHILLLILHHIVIDAWSIAVLQRDLSALYATHATGVHAKLPHLAIQYADYAVWERSDEYRRRAEEQLAVWKTRTWRACLFWSYRRIVRVPSSRARREHMSSSSSAKL